MTIKQIYQEMRRFQAVTNPEQGRRAMWEALSFRDQLKVVLVWPFFALSNWLHPTSR